MEKLKIFNVKWASQSAGPSLTGTRTEVFLAGCQKAASGNPCKGCFNVDLWDEKHCIAEETPADAAANIMRFAPNKDVTFVGGEPLDQAEPLTETCRILKENGYHITVITHYRLGAFIDSDRKLLENIDIVIDGEYDYTKRIWDESRAGDNVHDVIGSANQMVWDLHEWNKDRSKEIIGVKAGDLYALALTSDKDLRYITNNETAATVELVLAA